MKLEADYEKLVQLLANHQEWLLISASGASFPLAVNEIEVELKQNRILFSFLDEKGFQTWRIAGFEENCLKINLNLTRNFGRDREKITLVPRASAQELRESIEIARLEKANKIAQMLVAGFKRFKLSRVALNKDNGRFAQIIIADRTGNQIAVLADVSGDLTPEVHLTTAILWLSKLEARRKKPIDEIWILAEKKMFAKLRKLHALLKENWRRRIKTFEIVRRNAHDSNSGAEKKKPEIIAETKPLETVQLWSGKKPTTKVYRDTAPSRISQEIINIAPDKIDFIKNKNGETMRFCGLPFARVRTHVGEEKCWFGIEREKRVLNEKSHIDFFELLENLDTYRRFDSPNKQHAFYRLAPEAWLESILRYNVKKLDQNLILSPLHIQFRAERDIIDLLALRRDGRLIIIEIKAAPDREMAFQAADYWRKIEFARRCGVFKNLKLFGELEIADMPAIIYLVAPTLSFHRSFDFLARCISTEIEAFRFNLAENWREKLKVMSISEIK